jgi:N4-gp56 family major capsid protein
VAITLTTTSNFSGTVASYIRDKAEVELRTNLPWANPDNGYISGEFVPRVNAIVFQRFADFAVSSSPIPLTEGTPPTAGALAISYESFSATQYGTTVGASDLSIWQNPTIMPTLADKVARHAALTIDTVVRTAVMSGSNVIYSGTATSRVLTNTGMTGALIRTARAKMEKSAIPSFDDGFYHMIPTQEQILAMQADTTKGSWTDANLYVNNRPLITGEIGTYFGVKVIDPGSRGLIVSGAGSGATDIHSAWIFGPQAFALADMQTLRTYYVPLGGDHSDPLAQSVLVGWKWTGGAKLLTATGEKCFRLETVETTV